MNSSVKTLLILLVVVVIASLGWGLLTMPDHRSTGQRISDAVDALPNGVDKAGRELEDRTPGARLGDAIKDTGQSVKDSTN